MKLFLIFAVVFSALTSFAIVPDVVITTLSAANGYATVGGRLATKPDGPVGISVRNGNIMYSTISDTEGRWAIVIRHLSTQVFATSWSLTAPSDRGNEVVALTTTLLLPWHRSVSATGSSTSETSAKYQTETSLRREIERERSKCAYDRGSFSYSGGFVYCNKSGNNYQCSATAYCSCRKP